MTSSPVRRLPFFKTVWHSIVSPAFYANLRNVSGWASTRYFALLIFFTVLGMVSVISFFVAQINAPVLLRDGYDFVLREYPDDLEITLSNSGVEVNQELPYAIPLSPPLTQYAENKGMNLVVFTTNEDMQNVQDFWEYDALAVITEDTLFVRQDKEQINVQDLRHALADIEEPVTVDQPLLQAIPIEDITSFWLFQPSFYVPVTFVVLLVFLFPAMLAAVALTLLMWSSLLWLLFRLHASTRQLSFGKTYQVSMHAYTPILLIGYIAADVKGLMGMLLFLIFASLMVGMGLNQQDNSHPLPAKSVAPTTPTKKVSAKPSAQRRPRTAATTRKSAAKKTTKKRAATKKSSVKKRVSGTRKTAKKTTRKQ